jgi:hypothetical protein
MKHSWRVHFDCFKSTEQVVQLWVGMCLFMCLSNDAWLSSCLEQK